MINAMNLSIKGKIEQEKQYHNKRYKKDPRRKLSTFYLITKTVKEDYCSVIYKDCKGKKILEYGCGTGSYAFELASRGGSYWNRYFRPCYRKSQRKS